MTGPGTLGIAERAILGSTIPWSVEVLDGRPVALTSGEYAIVSEGDNPRYWIAHHRGAPMHASGAGEFGVAKCIKACERHSAASPTAVMQPADCSSQR